MKVFISWSGETSHAVALALRDWLPSVLQSIEPYVSSEDIEKGARWSLEIGRELDSTSFGILCVTPRNVESAWLNFEAGALAKSLDTSRVSPILLGMRAADLVGPLAQFQATLPEQKEMVRLVSSINANSDHPIDEARLQEAVKMWWPQLEEMLQGTLKLDDEPHHGPQRSVPDMMVEILEITRELQKRSVNEDRSVHNEGRVGGENVAVSSPREEFVQIISYKTLVTQALNRVLPPGAWLAHDPTLEDRDSYVGDGVILRDGHSIFVEVKYRARRAQLSMTDLRGVVKQVRVWNKATGQDAMLLIVSNVPPSPSDQVLLRSGSPYAAWTQWTTVADDYQLEQTVKTLTSHIDHREK